MTRPNQERVVYALALCLVIIGAISLVLAYKAMARTVEPFGLVSWTEQNYGANRPWLDPTCFDDDHTAGGYAAGWLNAGQSWSFDSPRVICSAKIQRGLLAYKHRLDADLTLIDYGRHTVPPARFWDEWRGTEWWVACNTDLGVLHVDLDPTGSEVGEPASVTTWTVTAHVSGWYELSMILDEPWWQGGESAVNYCRGD